MATYLENYLETIKILPQDLVRKFELMKDLDSRSKKLLEQVEVNSKTLNATIKSKHLKTQKAIHDDATYQSIQHTIKNAINLGEEKLSLASQTYEMVDKHIRRLDEDLRKFATELEASEKVSPGQLTRTAAPVAATETAAAARSRKRKAADMTKVEAAPLQSAAARQEMDLPIDPNEPTYCTCSRVSYGEMIGCDNTNCRVEWFHIGCVGLKAAPKGKWLCDECRLLKEKGFA